MEMCFVCLCVYLCVCLCVCLCVFSPSIPRFLPPPPTLPPLLPPHLSLSHTQKHTADLIYTHHLDLSLKPLRSGDSRLDLRLSARMERKRGHESMLGLLELILGALQAFALLHEFAAGQVE